MPRAFLGLYVLLNVAIVTVGVELAGRTYYVWRRHQSFWVHPRHFVRMYYPELAALEHPPVPGSPRVLLLGGSALHPDWGPAAARLGEALSRLAGRPVELVNAAVPSHGTLDSLHKYQLAGAGPRFDLVLVYHGINELRANNVPARVWRDDYSHYAWYDEINYYFRHRAWSRVGLVTPFYLKYLMINARRKVPWATPYVPQHTPRPE
jgi:hypothetical protein